MILVLQHNDYIDLVRDGSITVTSSAPRYFRLKWLNDINDVLTIKSDGMGLYADREAVLKARAGSDPITFTLELI